MRGRTPVPRLARETAESPQVPLVFQRLSTLGRARHCAHRVTRGQAPKQAWKAGLALVTSQCHMQIRDVTAHRLGATNREPRTQLQPPPAETDKEPERGAQGVSWGARSPQPRGRDSPGAAPATGALR